MRWLPWQATSAAVVVAVLAALLAGLADPVDAPSPWPRASSLRARSA